MTARRKKPSDDAPAVVSATGEIIITLEGVDYTMRPSFAAISEIETGTGRSVFDLAQAAERSNLQMSDIGIIVAACIRHEVPTIRPARAAELVYGEIGGLMMAVRREIKPLLFFALTGGYTPQGFRRAQTPTP